MRRQTIVRRCEPCCKPFRDISKWNVAASMYIHTPGLQATFVCPVETVHRGQSNVTTSASIVKIINRIRYGFTLCMSIGSETECVRLTVYV